MIFIHPRQSSFILFSTSELKESFLFLLHILESKLIKGKKTNSSAFVIWKLVLRTVLVAHSRFLGSSSRHYDIGLSLYVHLFLSLSLWFGVVLFFNRSNDLIISPAASVSSSTCGTDNYSVLATICFRHLGLFLCLYYQP